MTQKSIKFLKLYDRQIIDPQNEGMNFLYLLDPPARTMMGERDQVGLTSLFDFGYNNNT